MRTPVDFRCAKPDDGPLLAHIEVSAAQSFAQFPAFRSVATQSPPQTISARNWPEDALILIAERAGKAVGFATAFDLDNDFYIDEIDVRPSAQKTGVASALILEMEKAGRAKGRSRLTLLTFADIPWNAPFYARRGFKILAPSEWGQKFAVLVANDAARFSKIGARVAMGRFF